MSSVVQNILSPSQRIRETAHKFIDHFSKEQTNTPLCSPWTPLLTDEQKERLVSEFSDGTKEGADSSFNYLAEGNHNVVTTHAQFPKLVFKEMSLKNAEAQLKAAKATHAFVLSQSPFWCRTPVATVIPMKIEGTEELRALYVEERLPIGLDVEENQEFWCRIFMHLNSENCTPLFRENLFSLVQQMCALVEHVGFWDAGSHNFPELSLDGTHICAVDFDEMPLDSTPTLGMGGIQALAQTFCHAPFADYLLERYKAFGLASEVERERKVFETRNALYGSRGPEEPSGETLIAAFQKVCEREQKKDLARQEALKKYDTLDWVVGNEREEKIRFNREGIEESGILWTLHNIKTHHFPKHNEVLENPDPKNLLSKREFTVQYNQSSMPRDVVLRSLNILKEQGFIYSFYDDYHKTRDQVTYHIWR